MGEDANFPPNHYSSPPLPPAPTISDEGRKGDNDGDNNIPRPSSPPTIAPVPRHKVPLGRQFTLTEWMSFKQTIPKRWPLEYLTRDQVTPHNNAEDCWVILHGLVFDVTPYLRYHPGGQSILLRYAGTDVSVPFRQHHNWVNWESLLDVCLVGRIVD